MRFFGNARAKRPDQWINIAKLTKVAGPITARHPAPTSCTPNATVAAIPASTAIIVNRFAFSPAHIDFDLVADFEAGARREIRLAGLDRSPFGGFLAAATRHVQSVSEECRS